MEDGGALMLTLRVKAGSVGRVGIASTRPADPLRRLGRRPATEIPALAGRLFSLCGVAQSLAARAAVEDALGIDAGAECRAVRGFLTLVEVADNHLWHLLMDVPPHLGERPSPELLRPLRSLRARLSPASLDAEAADAAVAVVQGAVAGLIPPPFSADATEEGLASWAAQGGTVAQRLMNLALSPACASFGRSAVPAVAGPAPAWYAARLAADPGFATHPTLDGIPAEQGALARAADAPVVAALLARHGNGLASRVAARLVDIARLPDRLRTLRTGLRPAPEAPLPEQGSGAGCGVAETARGRLAHWVSIEAGRVTDWRVSAPTEWTFHPGGALARGLAGAEATADLARMAGLLVLALDPCVPCRITIEELVDA